MMPLKQLLTFLGFSMTPEEEKKLKLIAYAGKRLLHAMVLSCLYEGQKENCDCCNCHFQNMVINYYGGGCLSWMNKSLGV